MRKLLCVVMDTLLYQNNWGGEISVQIGTFWGKKNISYAAHSSKAFQSCLFENRDMKVMFCFSRLELFGILYFEVVMRTMKTSFSESYVTTCFLTFHYLLFFQVFSFSTISNKAGEISQSRKTRNISTL